MNLRWYLICPRCLSLGVLMLGMALSSAAQATAHLGEKDTVVLSVYNDNQKYMLYPTPFHRKWPDTSLVVPMIMLYDTLNVMRESLTTDSASQKPMTMVVERLCDKMSGEAQGKVALVRMNPHCDPSLTFYLAQRQGAKVVVMIHTTNSRDSVTLPKAKKPTYAYRDSITIPCFTVRNEIGDRLMRLLPSLVGIKVPDNETIHMLRTDVKNNVFTNEIWPQKVLGDSLKTAAAEAEKQRLEAEKLSNPPVKGWMISPNPSSTQVMVQYHFETAEPTQIEVFNAAGQLVTNYTLSETASGTLSIDVSTWTNGTYSVRLGRSSVKEVKQLVVQN